MEIPFRELQHCNTVTVFCVTSTELGKTNLRKKIKISCEVFVDRNGNVVPLHCNRKRHANEMVEALKPIGSGSQRKQLTINHKPLTINN